MLERLPGEQITIETMTMTHETVDKQKRYSQILECLGGGAMTAKELAVEMFRRGYTPGTERNFTAPRLTELSQQGVVEPVGKKKCDYSGKMVAVYRRRDDV